jgi:hypothetical protein
MEERIIMNENSMWWYINKKDAVDTAAGIAIDNLRFCDQQDMRLGNKFCYDPTHEAADQLNIEEIPFLRECGDTI